ncbi:hypothetical protein FRC09_018412, partial [Ceratobasidium sp. 395]
PVKRKTTSSRKRKTKPKPVEESDAEESSEGGELELDLPLNYFQLNIPVGDPTDKQDKTTEPIKWKLSRDWDDLRSRVADAMGCPLPKLPPLSFKLVASKGTDSTALRSEEEYDAMIEIIRDAAEQERDRVHAKKEKARSSSKKKGKGKAVAAPSKTKQRPVEVRLIQSIALNKKVGNKNQFVWPGWGPNAPVAAKSGKLSTLDFANEIKRQHECAQPGCEGECCVTVPDPTTGGTKHVTLSNQNIQLWSNLVSLGKAELAFPPKELRLYDHQPLDKRRKQGQVTATAIQPGQGTGQSSRSASGSGPGALPLSQWLVECDVQGRNEAGDNFLTMAYGFEVMKIKKLSDLRGVDYKFFQELKLTKPDGSVLTIELGTAMRLARLVADDLQANN